MLADAGLDWYERGDIFARVAAMRPGPAPGAVAQQAQLADQLRTLLATPAAVTSTLFPEGDIGGAAARWNTGFTDAGRRFTVASSGTTLSRGLRAILAHTLSASSGTGSACLRPVSPGRPLTRRAASHPPRETETSHRSPAGNRILTPASRSGFFTGHRYHLILKQLLKATSSR